jgi:hypothetical protein
MWLGHYETPLPIRCRGSFHTYAARDHASGAPHLIIVPAPQTPVQAAREKLARLASAHEVLGGDSIPPLATNGAQNEFPYVALACDAVCDGEAMIQQLGETGQRVTYTEAVVVVDCIARALDRAHTTIDPEIGAPYTLGALSWANVFIGARGQVYVLGFGHNTVVMSENDSPAGAPSVFIAPEIAAGAPPTPSADLYAFVMLQRSVLSYCVLPPALDRAFRGESEGDDPRIGEAVYWANVHIVTAPPNKRATVAEARVRYRAEWEGLGVRPDEAGLAARFGALLHESEPPPPSEGHSTEGELAIGPDAAWVRTPSGDTYDLKGRGALRRLLLRLARHWREARGERIDASVLLEAGWPGERPIREAGLNRVYVALSTLRKMGLREVIDRDDRGYRIDPSVRVRLEGVDP